MHKTALIRHKHAKACTIAEPPNTCRLILSEAKKKLIYFYVMTAKSCACANKAHERCQQRVNPQKWFKTKMNSTWVVLFSLLCPLQGSFPRLLKLPLFSYRLVEHLAEHTVTFSNQEHALKLVIQHGGLVHDVLARLEPTNLQHGDEVKGTESHLV